MKDIHECEFCKGKIGDVTLRKSCGIVTIHCRRCGERLKESQVDPKILWRIKK